MWLEPNSIQQILTLKILCQFVKSIRLFVDSFNREIIDCFRWKHVNKLATSFFLPYLQTSSPMKKKHTVKLNRAPNLSSCLENHLWIGFTQCFIPKGVSIASIIFEYLVTHVKWVSFPIKVFEHGFDMVSYGLLQSLWVQLRHPWGALPMPVTHWIEDAVMSETGADFPSGRCIHEVTTDWVWEEWLTKWLYEVGQPYRHGLWQTLQFCHWCQNDEESIHKINK